MRVSSPRPASRLQLVAVPLLALLALGGWGTYFFVHSQNVLENRLKSEMQETAVVAALQFDHALLDVIRKPSDRGSAAFQTVARQLYAIKQSSPLVRSAYIMRKTDDPQMLQFVVDADVLEPEESLDENGDGMLDESEYAPLPGDPYDVRDVPAMLEAFLHPTTDPEITTDQWGQTISGYAPILDPAGRAVAIIGIDMDAGDFASLSRQIFSPVSYLLVLCAFLFLAGYLSLWIWRRKAEVLREIERERTALLDLLLHQLGAPLASMRWWLELLHEHPEQHRDDEFRRNMEESVARMGGIMTALYDASRFHRGDIAEGGHCDAAAIAREIVNEAEKRCALRRQPLHIDVPAGPARLQMDAGAIGGVLRELIENASGYSPDGAPIDVRVQATEHGVTLQVQDRGCGIPKSDLPRIGERFLRAANAVKHKPVGNGLGLFIARGIIERAGGTLTIESTEGKGTTVTVTLPTA